jgi:two-component system nitrate/nitrite response regulator NarL
MNVINVVLVDANRLFREGLRRIIGNDRYQIVGEFGSVSEALARFEMADNNVRMLICDPGANPVAEFANMKALKERMPTIRIVILTDTLASNLLGMALASGADSYLPKNISSDALRYSMEIVLLEEEIFPMLMRVLYECAMDTTSPQHAVSETPVPPLSLRETQILRCLMNGTSNKGIARELNMAEATVKVHLKSLLRKLNASNRTQAAIRGVNDPSLFEGGLGDPSHHTNPKVVLDNCQTSS